MAHYFVILLLSQLFSGGCFASTGYHGLVLNNGSKVLKPLLFLNPSVVSPGSGDGWREQASAEPIHGIYLQDAAKAIASKLRRMANEEMGVTHMQSIFDSIPFATNVRNDEQRLQELSSRLQSKLRRYAAVLNKTRNAVEELFLDHLQKPISLTMSCEDIDQDRLIFSSQFGTSVLPTSPCDSVPTLRDPMSFSPGHNLTDVFANNLHFHPLIKWQYFIGVGGLQSHFPAHHGDHQSTHHNVYLTTMHPQPKAIVILIDHGNSLSQYQMEIAKNLANQFLLPLSPWDYISVLGISSEARFPDHCHQMSMASQENKAIMKRFIIALQRDKVPTNHSLGLEIAFSLLQSVNSSSSVLVYISRGLLSSITQAKDIMITMATVANKTKSPFIVSTCALIDDSRGVMYEKTFLRALAHQSYSKYNITSPIVDVLPGVMVTLNSTRDLHLAVEKVFSVLPKSTRGQQPILSLPQWDYVGKGMVLSLSLPCFHVDHPIGVVGVDLHLTDITEDITFLSQYGHSYAFLTSNGVVLAHPLLPSFTIIPPITTQIGIMQVEPHAKQFNHDMEETGNYTVPNGFTYRWQHVPGWELLLWVVGGEGGRVAEGSSRGGGGVPPKSSFALHPLLMMDKVTTKGLCHHLSHLSTLESPMLFLSPSCFFSPLEWILGVSTSPSHNHLAYLSDATKLIANPGLKGGVRSQVAALVPIAYEWKRTLAQSPLTRYFVRRYVATPTGVLLSYPGNTIDRAYLPNRQLWYMQAVSHPGSIVASPPVLDPGGSGYVVTFSHTVYEGKSAAMHGVADTIEAVIAIDFTLGYVHKMLLDHLPFCMDEETVRCFLMDERGYLVTHPSLLLSEGFKEQQHLTHKEPLVASDILNHRRLVQKQRCLRALDRTTQRSYAFNLSLPVTLTNLVHGEHCSRYQLAPLPGTNLLLGVVNDTCADAITAFCPCSLVDRACLNCHRMEQSECECPCECHLGGGLCPSTTPVVSHIAPCLPQPEASWTVASEGPGVDLLPPCITTSCQAFTNHHDCLGVVGCQWCHLDSDGARSLKGPFCTAHSKCFGGVLGAPTPYHNTDTVPLPSEDSGSFRSAPVGPVAGGIMCFFLVMALLLYCYRYHRGGGVSGSGNYDSGVRMSQLNNEMEEDSHCEDPNVTGHQSLLLEPQQAQVAPSPYRVNPTYRRPPGGDSDHGYSTMTPPNEDSEHLPTIEPLLIGRERPHPPSSRASSPLVPPPPSRRQEQMTVLPQHNLLVPVTVHMVEGM